MVELILYNNKNLIHNFKVGEHLVNSDYNLILNFHWKFGNILILVSDFRQIKFAKFIKWKLINFV